MLGLVRGTAVPQHTTARKPRIPLGKPGGRGGRWAAAGRRVALGGGAREHSCAPARLLACPASPPAPPVPASALNGSQQARRPRFMLGSHPRAGLSGARRVHAASPPEGRRLRGVGGRGLYRARPHRRPATSKHSTNPGAESLKNRVYTVPARGGLGGGGCDVV